MLTQMADLTSKHLARRKLASGAKAGIGIAIALAAVIAVGIIVFVIVRHRRTQHLDDIEKERAKLAGEKKEEEEPKSLPKRNKSIKDRLKGPLYQDTFDMPPVKQKLKEDGTPGGPEWDDVDGQGLNHKPWAESSPRPSFSSRRGTRMMMMM
jgi:flagellar biosynthesis/type III secretory pathway M-ring protein FliF/YscJ